MTRDQLAALARAAVTIALGVAPFVALGLVAAAQPRVVRDPGGRDRGRRTPLVITRRDLPCGFFAVPD